MTLRPTRRKGADGRWQEIQLELSHSCHEREEPPRDVFPQEFVHLDRPDLCGWTACWSHIKLSSRTSAVISCLSVNDRIHHHRGTASRLGPFSFCRNMSCVLRRNRHSSGKSPIAQLIVRMSRPRNRRGLCRAPAIHLWGPGALMRASIKCESDAITCFAAPLFAHCTPRCCVPVTTPSTTRCLGRFCIGGMSSKARAPWNQGCSPVLSTIC